MPHWGSFSPDSYESFLNKVDNPVDYMVVAPALAPRAATNPSSFMMDEQEDDEGDMYDWEDEGYEDEEDIEPNAGMAMSQLRSMAEDIMSILSEMTPYDNLEPWVAAKITMSKQNISAVADYLRFGSDFSEGEFDFARCQRPDGSTYGSRGKCRKGSEVSAVTEEEPKPKTKKKKDDRSASPVPPFEDVKELTEKAKGFTYGKSWTKDHQEVWNRILASPDTKTLGSLTRKLNKEVFDDSEYDVSAGFLKGALKTMKEWLEANGRSGVGAAKEARIAAMTPEERKRAASAERVERGIRAGVVKGRMI